MFKVGDKVINTEHYCFGQESSEGTITDIEQSEIYVEWENNKFPIRFNEETATKYLIKITV